jgi:hypothetical protein
MKTLTEYAKSKSNFVSLKSGETYSCIYRGYKFIEKDSFGETKEYARYLLEDLEDNQVRNLDSQSAKFAEDMSVIKEGSKIKITREGEAMETKYHVEQFTDEFPVGSNPPGIVTDNEIPIIEENENS